MVEGEYFEENLTGESVYSPTYKSFLDSFIREVESLSRYGEKVWDSLFEEIDIFTQRRETPAHPVEWLEREKIANHKFHLQCASLCREEVYHGYELGRYSCFPEDAGWRKGENQTAKSLVGCKGDEHLISALFIYAAINSGDRHSKRIDEGYIFEESSEFCISPKSGLFTLLKLEKIIQPLENLDDALFAHLNEFEIWHDWARSCTSLVPIINDRRGGRQIFSSYYDFSAYLAEQFVLLSSKLCVCVCNQVLTEDRMLMSRIEAFAAKNKREHKKINEELKLSQKIYDEEKLELRKKSALEYEELCNTILDYTEEIPSVFEKYGPLENRWRGLDPKTLEILIWSAPLTLLSKMFKKSDNGVRKWAIEYSIPLPKVGFWAKVRSGRAEYPNGSPNLKHSNG